MIIGKKKDISFIDILSLIKCPEKYYWKIVWIYAFYYPSNLVYLEDKINSSKGYDIKLEDLKRLIESVGQLIELILIARFFEDEEWHDTNAKKDYLKKFEKKMKGDTNADFHIDKDTNDIYLKTNKKDIWINTGDKFE